ncbi:MAG TPA: ChaN family lipoprotein [Lamprocystis sp. (in: g-proteobacteria)]|nr:ChaN family lipoprotein [Lamprocystis sp. (in: g-proteobacteria)]
MALILAVSLGLGLLTAPALFAAESSVVASPPAASTNPPPTDTPTQVLDTRTLTTMEQLLDAIADRRVIFVGESHDRYEDHLNQLKVIEGLKRRGKDLAIGMEVFQQPYQPIVDAYIAGGIDEATFLRQTQYFDRWRFDYRLYRPILDFARQHRIPVIALNLEAELTRRAGEAGIEGLTPQERARIPAEIDRSDTAYQARVAAVFAQHPMPDKKSLERFMEVQLLWDEGMAERAARYLKEHPEKTLVVLAGGGHIEYGQGIPKRLLRRVPAASATLLNANQRELDPTAADYLLFPKPVDLPAAGLLGVSLTPEPGTLGAEIQGFAEDSGAKAAGAKEGDLIVRVGAQPVAAYADIRIALIDSRPGQRVPVEVRRKRLIGEDETLTFEVELH